MRQSCPPTPGQPEKLPFHIPFAVGLVGPDGSDIPLQLEGDRTDRRRRRRACCRVTERRAALRLRRRAARARCLRSRAISPRRSIVNYDYDERSLTHLMAHDTRPVQPLGGGPAAGDATHAARRRGRARRAAHSARPGIVRRSVRRACSPTRARDPAFAAEALSLPSEGFLAEQMDVVDPDAIHAVRIALARTARASCCATSCLRAYRAQRSRRARTARMPRPPASARCATCASRYLMETGRRDSRAMLAVAQFDAADNMTDAMAALAVLADFDCAERTRSARRVLRALEGRAAGGRQMAARAGDVAPARHARAK